MAAFSAPPIGCLLMAAGNASRFGENKLTARFDGQSLFSRALEAIPAGVFVRVTVVSQYPSLLEEASQAGFDAILNDRPEDGISRTIRLGTRAMADCAGILYMVAAAGRNGTTHCGRMAGTPELHYRRSAQRKARQPVPVSVAVFPGTVCTGGRPWRLIRHSAARRCAAARRGRRTRTV